MTQPNQELLNFITALRAALPEKWINPGTAPVVDQTTSVDQIISTAYFTACGHDEALDQFTQIIDQLSKEYGIPENWGDIE